MITAILHQAVLAAQAIIMDGFGKDLPFKAKENHRNLLSEIDEASQKKIKTIITKELSNQGVKEKDIGFIGEENLFKPAEHTFIIDPVDGTTNFVSNIPYFGISIAYAYQGKVTHAVIFDPVNSKLFYAQKGKGAFVEENRQDKKLKIQKSDLSKCIMNTYISADDKLAEQMFRNTKKITPFVRGIRSLGSGTMEVADICQNRLGILIYNTSWIWDLAGSKLLIEEAGGQMTDWQGKEIKFDFTKANKRYPCIIAHQSLIPGIVRIINKN